MTLRLLIDKGQMKKAGNWISVIFHAHKRADKWNN